MKKITTIFFLALALNSYAQPTQFTYDTAGNRVQRSMLPALIIANGNASLGLTPAVDKGGSLGFAPNYGIRINNKYLKGIPFSANKLIHGPTLAIWGTIYGIVTSDSSAVPKWWTKNFWKEAYNF